MKVKIVHVQCILLIVLVGILIFPTPSFQSENTKYMMMGGNDGAIYSQDILQSELNNDIFSPETYFMSAEWLKELPSESEIISNSLNIPNPEGIDRSEYSAFDSEDNNKTTETDLDFQLLSSPTGTDEGNPYTPSEWRRQELQSPAKNGHWFPFKGQSVLAFLIDLPAYVWALDIFIDIEPDQETIYSRMFYVYFDGNEVYSSEIFPQGSNSGFHSAVTVWGVGAGEHEIELEISWGAHKDHAWKLTYIQPFESQWPASGNPILAFWEYFPQEDNSLLEYEVKGGTSTIIDLWTENDNDPYSRNLKVYVNGNYKFTVTSPGSYEESLSYEPSDGTAFVLGLELVGSNTYYGKRINFNHVTYRVQQLEVDRMQKIGNSGYILTKSKIRNMIDYTRTYHILRGFTRFDYDIDNDFIPYDGAISNGDFSNLRNQYFTHDYDPWQWCLIGTRKYLDSGYEVLGMYGVGERLGFCIFEDACKYQSEITGNPSILAYRRTAFLHEFNHNTGILILNSQGYEVYCSNPECCMDSHHPENPQNIKESPWCCQYYWALRDPPWV